MHSRDKRAKAASSSNSTDMKPEMNMTDIRNEIEFLTSSHMSWKDKKEIENRKVVSLGGKPQKKQRLPLSVARPIMKKQKEREQKMVGEHFHLLQFGGIATSNYSKRSLEKRKPEDRVLKSSEGIFRKGVLHIGHLRHPAPTRNRPSTMKSDFGNEMVGTGRRKGGKKKNNKSKKKGGSKKRH